MLNTQRLFKCLFIILMILMCCSVSYGSMAQEENSIENVKLPPNWTVQKIAEAPKETLIGLSQKLGGELVSAKNYLIDVKGVMLKIGVAECKTEEDAQKIYQYFLSHGKKEEECLLKGIKIFEFQSNSSQLINMARSLWSGEAETSGEMMDTLDQAVWKVKIIAAPLQKADYMSIQTLSNLMMSYQENPESAEIKSQIENTKKQFAFSNLIHLRYEVPPWGAPQYSIENAEKTAQENDIVTFSVDEPQYKLGIPYIEIHATIPVKLSTFYRPRSEINKTNLTAETPYWPASDTKIKERLGTIIKSEMTSEQKIKAIHSWVREHIKYGGERIGTRYGVAQVLQQGFGRCWDLCDVFVTLCRAAKIPARQVMGWIYGKSGHVWVEAYIEEKGWCLLDPTTPSGSVTTDYVPFFISEDGEMPAVYWAMPHLEIHKKKD
jgi:hypothetical protein